LYFNSGNIISNNKFGSMFLRKPMKTVICLKSDFYNWRSVCRIKTKLTSLIVFADFLSTSPRPI